MSIRRANLLGYELEHALDRSGFAHRAASVGQQIGGVRIGVGVYEAEAGRPIWPHVSIFPDSDKLSVWPGPAEVGGLDALRLTRSGAVDYWQGEGDGPLDPVNVVREPAAPSLPVVHALTEPVTARPADASAGLRWRAATLGPGLGASLLVATVLELAPGEGSEPYHYVYGREQWLLVLAGEPALSHPDGQDLLQAADVVCFPDGPAGAHRLFNRGTEVVRALLLSTTRVPANVHYPDTATWLLHNTPGEHLTIP